MKNNFTATSIFYPHYQNEDITQNQGLRGLAGLAGINLGSTQVTDNIPPTLYPNIISSPNFKIKILDSEIVLNGEKVSYREYLLSKNDQFNLKKIFLLPLISVFNLITKNNLKSNVENINILKLSEEEYYLHNYLTDVIYLELNEKEGFIKLSVKDINPIIASQIAKIANELLQENIIDFKLKNLNDTYKFISQH